MSRSILVALVLAAFSLPAGAAIVFQDLGHGTPPATLGGYAMTQFVPSTGGMTCTSTLPSPFGSIASTAALYEGVSITANFGGFTGSGLLLGTNPGICPATVDGTPTTLTLPAGTKAFYFYWLSNQVGTFLLTATANGTTVGSAAPLSDAGARGFAFYADAGEDITTIQITPMQGVGFYLGNFAIASGATASDVVPVPAASPLALAVLALILAATALGIVRN